jgi:GPH family glycoside/pentoside/hexuronide:cation symporter
VGEASETAGIPAAEPADGKKVGILKFHEVIGFGLGTFGANMAGLLVGSFLMIYMTDYLGVAAATVGTIFLLVRIFDGVSDIAMGFVVDKTVTRWGKARPWLLYTALPMGLLPILIFNTPMSLDLAGRTVYAGLLYFVFNVIVFTANAVPYNTLSNYMSPPEYDRMKLGAAAALFLFVSAGVAGFIPQFRALLGGPNYGWTRVAFLFSGLCVVFLIITFLMTKERVKAVKKDTVKGNVREMLGVMLTDKYFYMTVAVFFLVNATNVGSANTIYFVKYYLGNENYNAVLSLVGIVPMGIGMFFAPALAKKLGMKRALIMGVGSSVLGSLVMWLAGKSISIIVLGGLIKGFGYVPAFASILAFIGNVGSYLYWKSGVPVQGLMFSVTSASQKLGAGFAAGLAGWLLTWGRYIPNAAEQPASAIFIMRFSVIIWPALMMFGILALLLNFKILDYTDKIAAEIGQGKFANGRNFSEL